MSTAAHFTEAAPAKVNLALHITGRRADGYHLLDSLITFLDLEDHLHGVVPADNALSLTVEGTFGAGLAGDDNLVLRAANLLRRHAGIMKGAALVLEKNIPVGAGLGGGSADAAAALRLLNRLWGCNAGVEDLQKLAAMLGADIPSCVTGEPARMQGIGEVLTPLPPLPHAMHVLVVYPNRPLPTPLVYGSGKATMSGLLPFIPAQRDDWWEAILQSGNDLYPAARSVAPEVDTMIDALNGLQDMVAVRMSGSGSACFALFDDARAAAMAAKHFAIRQPQAWSALCRPAMPPVAA